MADADRFEIELTDDIADKFNEEQVLEELRHFLPAQAPLKDFIHHNTLHAFQNKPFHQALQEAAEIFGYSTYLPVSAYRQLFLEGRISESVLEQVIVERRGRESLELWKERLIREDFDSSHKSRIGKLRVHWKQNFRVNLDKDVHPVLFRLLGSYLDQGIALWQFSKREKGFLHSVRVLESDSLLSLFHGKRARRLLLETDCNLSDLLQILVGRPSLYRRYLFDQAFCHPGWSGMVSVLERHPEKLLYPAPISLRDAIALELLLEIDALDNRLGNSWEPLASKIRFPMTDLFESPVFRVLYEVYAIWQEAFEWSYFDQVLKGLQMTPEAPAKINPESFAAIVCLDDRACSFRRYLEKFAPGTRTYGTPGHFNIDVFFQPEQSRFYTKVCPDPEKPTHLVRASESGSRYRADANFSRHSQSLIGGWALTQTYGYFSAFKLAESIFRPAETPSMVSSFQHMDRKGKLAVEAKNPPALSNSLQEGFEVNEMATIVESLLRSIGLVRDFPSLVYVIGHGASSVNNTYYAAYDCGACSGRAGSVNARVFAFMANHAEVRALLRDAGLDIPPETQFVAGLHDTTRDEMQFYDEDLLPLRHATAHQLNLAIFRKTLDSNAWERSRRFHLINSAQDPRKVHAQVGLRAMSLFEPRPEWNHATNALCIIGRRESNRHLFLDRRSFLSSYDYREDPDGDYLLGILQAVAPVCGGINLEYYFSRVDNSRLGAGTKLPHNVMGLLGVANGIDGDLRTGLPSQMVDIHEPLRLLLIVEQDPEIVLKTIRRHTPTLEWFANEWILLAAVRPGDRALFLFRGGEFYPYVPLTKSLETLRDTDGIVLSGAAGLPVYLLEPQPAP